MSEWFRVLWAETGQPVTNEDLVQIACGCPWARHLVYCDMEGFAIGQDGSLLLLDECGSLAYPPEGLFRVEWLCDPRVREA